MSTSPETPTALIQGSSRGIGLALTRALLERGWRVVATCRSPDTAHQLTDLAPAHPGLSVVALDVSDEGSISRAAGQIREQVARVNLLVNAAGVLHGPGFAPEKKLEQLDATALRSVFEVNAFGPALVLKHFKPLLQHTERCVVANLSARVGSIGDNRLGGWYAYRASKAAQNMFTKCASLELGRGSRRATVIAIHPGTVETDLSAPFARDASVKKRFSPERAAAQILTICDDVTEEQTGTFFAWDGSTIEW